MERNSLNYLKNWVISPDRKPLVIRGARQVGKTWLVRHLAAVCHKQLIELNLEKQPNYASLFASNDPHQILFHLEAALKLNEKIDVSHCLLFLDEIQTTPSLLSKLRWFFEELPDLPVIAAGSLLEFTLADHAFSMPVGRISYMHLEPVSFEEFLLASHHQSLMHYLTQYHLTQSIPEIIHEQLMQLFKEYVFIGGFPAVIVNWLKTRSLGDVNRIQMDLLTTYRDDFAKYKGRLALERVDNIFMVVPKMLGQKFVFSQADTSVKPNAIKQILDLLHQARVCHRVFNCSGNGVPLAAEIKEKHFKEIFVDSGLCGAALGLNFKDIQTVSDISLINRGGMAEQIAGQLLRTIEPVYIEPALYYWHRDESNSNAEVDYLLQHGNQVIPIEVKSGSTGSLKSLHLLMGLKKWGRAVRIYSGFPMKTQIEVSTHFEDHVSYELLSIPFYLIGQLHRLLNELS